MVGKAVPGDGKEGGGVEHTYKCVGDRNCTVTVKSKTRPIHHKKLMKRIS